MGKNAAAVSTGANPLSVATMDSSQAMVEPLAKIKPSTSPPTSPRRWGASSCAITSKMLCGIESAMPATTATAM